MHIAKVAHLSREGHIGSAYSILDILWVLYKKIIKEKQDIFILSKGHASLALYAMLMEMGKITETEFYSFCEYESKLGGHPDYSKINGVEASTGSLGHGLPLAVGRALARKAKNQNGKIYCLIGDGECNEGSIWESILLASHHKLDNLYCIVDHNHSGDRALDLGELDEKFRTFGWNSEICLNGHNHEEIYNSLLSLKKGVPKIIIANTIKGKGILCMENNPSWHHKSPTKEDLESFIMELSA